MKKAKVKILHKIVFSCFSYKGKQSENIIGKDSETIIELWF